MKRVTIEIAELQQHLECELSVDFGKDDKHRMEYSIWCKTHKTPIGNTATLVEQR